MITTTERQEKLIDQYGALINPSKARVLREAGLGIIESRRAGPYVWDQSGTRYIDCRDDSSVYNVGRRNPELVQTLISALDEYDLGNAGFFSEPRVQLAHKLGQLSPGGKLTGVAFGAGAEEINGFAINLARALTGRKKVISIQHAPSLSDLDITHVPFDDLEAVDQEVDSLTACVIVEPIQAFAGNLSSRKDYLKRLRAMCNRVSALLIVDETITGLGRTGKMFALEHEKDVMPDVITLGNALSGGLFPISAAIFKDEYLKFWNENPFVPTSSFAGSDLGCVIALAAIEYIEKNKLTANATAKGKLFAAGFKGLISRFPAVIKEFRNCGLLMTVDFITPEIGPQMSRDLSQFGILAAYDLEYPDSMRINPALTITDEDVEDVLDGFCRALAGAHSIAVPMSQDVLIDLIRSIRS